MKIGIIGLSVNNGHPYSFSAILNGYDKVYFRQSGWDVILNYLEKQKKSSFGISNAKVTHAWTQNFEITKQLCKACYIKNACNDYNEMLSEIDALIIARDDWKSHFKIAYPFLKKGIPVFIDKPLTLDEDELNSFLPYLKTNKLMSCSGFRYSKELDHIRNEKKYINSIKIIHGAVVNDFFKYGIHLLEAISGVGFSFKNCKIEKLSSKIETYLINLENDTSVVLSCLGRSAKIFNLNIYSKNEHIEINLNDNFTAFKRTLFEFIKMVKNKDTKIDPNETVNLIKVLINCKKISENL